MFIGHLLEVEMAGGIGGGYVVLVTVHLLWGEPLNCGLVYISQV